jgi:hypothetical protein
VTLFALPLRGGIGLAVDSLFLAQAVDADVRAERDVAAGLLLVAVKIVGAAGLEQLLKVGLAVDLASQACVAASAEGLFAVCAFEAAVGIGVCGGTWGGG